MGIRELGEVDRHRTIACLVLELHCTNTAKGPHQLYVFVIVTYFSVLFPMVCFQVASLLGMEQEEECRHASEVLSR